MYHGWKYDITGQCVDTPNEPPASRFKERIKVRSYATREAGGLVWAYMGDDDVPPVMPWFEWLSLTPANWHMERYLTESNYLQALEGDQDTSHASHLHSTLDNRLADHVTTLDGLHSHEHMSDKAPASTRWRTGLPP